MRARINISPVIILVMILVLSSSIGASQHWNAPFDISATNTKSSDSLDSMLTLDDILRLVATHNPLFKSYALRQQAAESNLSQAKLWSNPEFGIEFEEVGWDAPGFQESELTISLAQSFELFGQRRARINVAKAGIDGTRLQVQQATFDLYLETKQRYYGLVHAMQKVTLSQASVSLAQQIVDNIKIRLDKGSALQSEFLLAQMQAQRTQLNLGQAQQEVNIFQLNLASLWLGAPDGFQIEVDPEPELASLYDQIATLSGEIDSSRNIIAMHSLSNLLRAEKEQAVTEARPSITLTSGFKRIALDNSKTFLLGLSMPLPLFNRNQGVRAQLDAQRRSLEYEIENARNEVRSEIESHVIRLTQLGDKHSTLDKSLLPTVREVYRTLEAAYKEGRIPYTHLLEAEETLNELSFEHNDLLLEIYEEIITLEYIVGVGLYVAMEK